MKSIQIIDAKLKSFKTRAIWRDRLSADAGGSAPQARI